MQKRPLWLISLTCFMMLYQIVWLINVLQLPDHLKAQVSFSVSVDVLISILIVTFFTFAIRALILKYRWAIRYTIGVFGIQIGYSLLRLIVFAEADYDRQRLPFLLILFSIVCGLLMLPMLLKIIHKSTKGEELV